MNKIKDFIKIPNSILIPVIAALVVLGSAFVKIGDAVDNIIRRSKPVQELTLQSENQKLINETVNGGIHDIKDDTNEMKKIMYKILIKIR